MHSWIVKSHLFTALVLCGALQVPPSAWAQPEGYKGVVAGKEPTVLHLVSKPVDRVIALPKTAKITPLDDLQFTGPKPSHPFVLGNYAADGKWGISNGYVQLIEGKNAALQLAWANEFEMDGYMEHSGYGGWFLLLGWNDGRGFAVSNVNMKESGSPWFISEMRGGKAIADRTKEYEKFDWKDEQPFRFAVEDEAFSLEVGKFKVFTKEPLPGYTPGFVVLGVYDTRYGPKPLRLRSLRVKSLEGEAPAAAPAKE